MPPALSDRISQPNPAGRLARDSASLRTFTLAEGVMMLVLGGLALIFPMVASVWVTAMVAIGFLVGGIVGWVSTLARSGRLSGAITFWRLTVDSLFLVTGAWMVRQLSAGQARAELQVAALALAVGVVFLIEGAIATVVALSHREVKGWGWGLANGIVTLILGLLILTMKQLSLVWVLGTLVGISFLFSGIDLLSFSASFHAIGRPGDDDRAARD